MVKRTMSLTYCGNIVRQQDSDRFLLSLMVKPQYREGLWALFAFNYEIAKTREVVSETQIGLIRLQWWRDAIAEIYEGKAVRKHDIVQSLAAAIKQYDLPRDDFDALIYAREFDLEGIAPANLEGFYHYCDYTVTPLFRLALRITGESVDEAILKSIVTRSARIGIIRSTAFLRQQRRVMLPQDILKKHNLSEQKFCDFKTFDGLDKVIKEIMNDQEYFRNGSSAHQSRFLKAVENITTLYEGQLKTAQYDVFDSKVMIPPKFMALRLWWGVMF